MKRPLLCLLILLAAACSSSDNGGGSESGGADGSAGSGKGGSSGVGGKAAGGAGNKTGGAGNATEGGAGNAGIKDAGIVDGDSGNGNWVATWATGVQETELSNRPVYADSGPYGMKDTTLRQFVHTTIAGNQVRLKLSNEFGDSDMVLDAVHVAASKGGDGGVPNGTVDPATDTAVKFDGKTSVTIPAGKHITSDVFSYNVPALTNVAITIHITAISEEKVTGHPGSRTNSYLQKGDAVTAASLENPFTTPHWYIIEALDVMADRDTAAAVVLGDSIADGRGSTTDGNNRWPDVFAKRLHDNAATAKVAVVNMGIGGNAVFNGGLGPSAKTRFKHDVLDQAGVKWVIVSEGVNDLGNVKVANSGSDAAAADSAADAAQKVAPVEGGADSGTTTTPTSPSSAQVATGLIEAYKEFIDKAHQQNLKIYGVPIPPIGQTQYYDLDAGIDNIIAERESARVQVNDWIKAAGHFDAVMDLPAGLIDPATNPPAQLPQYWNADSDRLHPNVAGHQKMGEACNLDLFTK